MSDKQNTMQPLTLAGAYSYKAPEHIKIEGGKIYFINQNYSIEVSEIRTHKQLSQWIYHLTGKPWVTVEILNQFIENIYTYRDWPMYEVEKPWGNLSK